VRAREHQVEPLVRQRHETEAVRPGGRLARHARVGKARGDRARDLEVADRPGVVARKFGGIEAEPLPFAVKQPACLSAGLPVDQAQLVLGDAVYPRYELSEFWPDHEAFPPRGEPHNFGAAGQLLRGSGVVRAFRIAQVDAGSMHEARGRESQGLLAPARPPGEGDRRVQQPERGR
jgi:hypothetical protein